MLWSADFEERKKAAICGSISRLCLIPTMSFPDEEVFRGSYLLDNALLARKDATKARKTQQRISESEKCLLFANSFINRCKSR